MADFLGAHKTISNLQNWFNASFEDAQEKIKRFEGGYSGDSRDPGNWTGGKIGSGDLIGTNWGISAPVLMTFLGKKPSVQDMKNLSYETALKIYKRNYWDMIRGDEIENQSVADVLYDGAVNQGVGAMKSIINDTLKTNTSIPFNKDVIEKINSSDQKKLHEEIKSRRLNRYDPSSYAYKSWMSRLEQLTFEGVEFAKRNWIPIVLTIGTIGFGIYMLFKYKKQIIKSV